MNRDADRVINSRQLGRGLTHRGVAIGCAFGLLVSVAMTFLAGPSIAAQSSSLLAGQSLYAYGPTFPSGASGSLTSPSGEFVLSVDSGRLTMEQLFGNNGCTPWSTAQFGSYSGTSRLTMQHDGNLVLYTSGGRALWSSKTAGTGTENRLVMQSDGRMIIYTAANRAVWSAGSGPGCLRTGMIMGSGTRLVSRYDRNNYSPTTSLVMGRSGDLVLYYGSTVEWKSRTFVPGSTAALLPSGDFAIYSPRHRLLWHTRTGNLGSTAMLFVDPCAGFYVTKPNSAGWHSPYVSTPGCL